MQNMFQIIISDCLNCLNLILVNTTIVDAIADQECSSNEIECIVRQIEPDKSFEILILENKNFTSSEI